MEAVISNACPSVKRLVGVLKRAMQCDQCFKVVGREGRGEEGRV